MRSLIFVSLLLLVSQVFAEKTPLFETMDFDTFKTWSSEFFTKFTTHYKTIELRKLDFIKELNIYSDYWVDQIKLIPESVEYTLLETVPKEKWSFQVTLPSIQIKFEIGKYISVPIRVTNFNIKFDWVLEPPM